MGKVSAGGQSVVYKAIQNSTKRKVAIKVMKEGPFADAADRARFNREVQILGQLNHPNVVNIHETGISGGCQYFVMDYVSGESLDHYVERAKPSIPQALGLFAKVCDAVNAGHLIGVIHRDLKPSNIRVGTNGEPHVLDFGLAKVATGESNGSMATMTGQFIGSLPWASPEQAEASPGKIDTRTDVYSLGVILYQMLTGQFPYEVVGNMRDVLDRIMSAEPARPSTTRRQIDDELDTIVLKCLAKARDRRYQTAGELGRDIRHYLDGEPIEAKRDSVGYILRKRLRRYRVHLAFGAILLAVIVAALVVSLRSWRQAESERKVAEATLQFLDQDIFGQFRAAKRDSTPPIDVVVKNAARVIDDRFNEAPRAEARVRSLIGSLYARPLFDEERAEIHLSRAADLCRREYGENHPATAAALVSLGDLLSRQRFQRYPWSPDPARDCLREALAIQRKVRGKYHPEIAETLEMLAATMDADSSYEEGEALCREALMIWQHLEGDGSDHVTRCLAEVARFCSCQAKYDQADSLYRAVIRRYGPDAGRAAMTMASLAEVLEKKGDNAAAEQAYRNAMETLRLAKNSDIFSARRITDDLAGFYERQNRRDDARQVRANLISDWTEGWEAGDPRSLDAKASLANLAWGNGEYQRSETLYREIMEDLTAVGEPDYSVLLGARSELAYVLGLDGRHAEAESLLRENLALSTRLYGERGTQTAHYMASLARGLSSLGKYDEAEHLLREQLKIAQTLTGGQSHISSRRYHLLAGRRLEVGEAWRTLGEFLASRDRHAEAEACFRSAMSSSADTLVTAERLEIVIPLINSLAAQDRYAEAESLATANLDAMLEGRTDISSRMTGHYSSRLLEALAETCDRWGRHDRYFPYLGRCAKDAISSGSDEMYLNTVSWLIVREGQPGEDLCNLAVEAAKAAVELRSSFDPDSYSYWMCLNTLGVAQYRAGRYDDALQTLRRCSQIEPDDPTDGIFSAMSLYKLGRTQEALAELSRLEELADQGRYRSDPEVHLFLGEARALIRPGGQ